MVVLLTLFQKQDSNIKKKTLTFPIFFCYFEQKQLGFFTRSIVLNIKFSRLTISNLFSRLGNPNDVLITSKASKVPNIPGVTPITGRGLSEESNERG